MEGFPVKATRDLDNAIKRAIKRAVEGGEADRAAIEHRDSYTGGEPPRHRASAERSSLETALGEVRRLGKITPKR
jgi:hypothetical protein